MRKLPKQLLLGFLSLFFILVLGTATPAAADTTGPVIDSFFPAQGQTLAPGWYVIQVRALDPDYVVAGSVQLLLNSQKVPAIVSYDLISSDPETETDTYDYTHALVTYRVQLSEKVYNVQLNVKDGQGNLTTKQWSFNVSGVPVFSDLNPAPFSTKDTRTPTISATVSELGTTIDPASIFMSVNGVRVPAVFDPITGKAAYTPTELLPVDQEQTIYLSAADVNGHSSSVRWTFTVIYPDMPVPSAKADCLRCHTGMPQAHPMSDCQSCHNVALRNIYAGTVPPPHFVAYDCYACHLPATHENGAIAGVTPWWPIDVKYSCEQCHTHKIEDIAPNHISTTTGDCGTCHSMVLEREHYRPEVKDKNGNPMTCFSCHANTNPLVQGAIASKNTACQACHTTFHAPPTPSHDNANFTALSYEPDMACANCHQSEVSDEHLTGSYTAARGYTCQTCHESSAPGVQAAITNKNLNCEACHFDPATNTPKVHTTAGSPYHDTSFALTKEVACQQCHATNIKTEHMGRLDANNSPMNCDTCHKSLNPAVRVAIQSKDTMCDSCHTYPTALHQPEHSTSVFTSDAARTDNCAGCHSTKDLKILHVGVVNNKTGRTMTCDSCHNSTDPVVTAAITNKSTNSCEACHNTGAQAPPVFPVHPPGSHQPAGFTTAAYTGTDKTTCQLCHTSSKLTDIHNGTATLSGNTMDCNTCHGSGASEQVKSAVVAKNNNCEACHTIHAVKPAVSQHDSTGLWAAAQDADCAACHSRNVRTEHMDTPGRTDADGNPVTCDSCHGSSNPLVVSAVTAGNTSCDACHAYPTAKHEPVHTAQVLTADTSRTDKSTCTLCHSTAVPAEHTGTAALSGNKLDCNTCHSTGATTQVKAAVAAKNNNCEACHTVHAAKPAVTQHDSTELWATTQDVDCSACHSRNVRTEHMDTPGRTDAGGHPVTCDSCHGSSNPLVVSAVATGNTGCDACHAYPTAKHSPVHETSVYTTDAARPDASDCASCHTTRDINALHTGTVSSKTGRAMTCDSCHGADADPMVKTAIANKAALDCASCHNNSATAPGLAPVHAPKDASSSHISSGAFVASPDTDCVSCHARNMKTEHIDKPGSTDTAGNPITCSTCHESSRTDIQNAVSGRNSSCTSCHAYPTSEHNPVHTSSVLNPDPARTDSSTCSLCHTTSLTAEHNGRVALSGKTMDCNTCHSSTAPAQVADAVKTNNSSCQACHAAHAAKPALTQHDSTGLWATTQDVGCAACHTRNVKAEHMDTPGRTDSSGNPVTCDSCHGSSNPLVVSAVATGNDSCDACHAYPTAKHNPVHTVNFFSTDNNRPDSTFCVNCHHTKDLVSLHNTVNTKTGQQMDCNSCHNSTDPVVKTAVAAGSTNDCSSCHNSSAVSPPLYPVHEPKQDDSCYGCHQSGTAAPDILSLMGEGSTGGKAYSHTVSNVSAGEAGGNGCLTQCHKPHNSFNGTGKANNTDFMDWDSINKIQSNDYKLCQSCHSTNPTNPQWTNGARAVNANYTSTMHSYDSTPNYHDYTNADSSANSAFRGNCLKCHNPHGTDNPYLLEMSVTGGNGVKTKQDISDYGVNANTVCQKCHSGAGSGSTAWWPGMTLYNLTAHKTTANPNDGRHGTGTGLCVSCHDPHGASDGSGLIPDMLKARSKALCYNCHTGSLRQFTGQAAYDSSSHGTLGDGSCNKCHSPHGKDNGTGNPYPKLLSGPYSGANLGTCWNTAGCHDSTSTKNVKAQYSYTGTSASSHNNCRSCHEPHSAASSANPPFTGALKGTTVVATVTWPTPAPGNMASASPSAAAITEGSSSGYGAGDVWRACLKCHSANSGDVGADATGAVDIAKFINPNNPSHHGIMTTSSTGHNPWLNQSTHRNTFVAATRWASSANPLDLFCSDCHGDSSSTGAKGTHGSNNRSILKWDPSTSGFCYNCHSSSVYSFSGDPNASHGGKAHTGASGHFAQQAGGPTNGCNNCHFGRGNTYMNTTDKSTHGTNATFPGNTAQAARKGMNGFYINNLTYKPDSETPASGATGQCWGKASSSTGCNHSTPKSY